MWGGIDTIELVSILLPSLLGAAHTHEINCMKYETFVWCCVSINFNGTADTVKLEIYASWNIF